MPYEELIKLPADEITNQLRKTDFYMMRQHRQGTYVKCPWMNGVEDKDEINKAINIDVIGFCVFGICAYKGKRLPNDSEIPKFYNLILSKPKEYIDDVDMPLFMKNYYYDVLYNQNIRYLYDYLQNYNFETNKYEGEDTYEGGEGKGITKVKATPIGKALNMDRESWSDTGFASVLILPAMLALVYIAVVVIYFVFFYGG